MRTAIKELLSDTVERVPVASPVFEFGSYQVPGQEKLIDTRKIFSSFSLDYIGVDMREGPGVDKILDLHHIDLPDGSAGMVVMIDTLEHVEFVRKAMQEVHRVLKDNGIVFMSSVMDFPIHAYPNDYWRFTPEGFRSLLGEFDGSVVTYLGRSNFPHTIIGIGCKGAKLVPELEKLKPLIDAWQKRYAWKIFSGWKELLRMITPPIIVETYIHYVSAQKNE